MCRFLFCSVAFLLITSLPVSAQVGTPGVEYSGVIAGGEGGQLYPFDRQDPWIHGQFQRVPAYGGFASFRPYNYRHVFAQTQIATGWGAAHGMPYSQQFWNRYRGSYLQGNLHSQVTPSSSAADPTTSGPVPIYQTSFDATRPSVLAPVSEPTPPAVPMSNGRPIHVFPQGVVPRQ